MRHDTHATGHQDDGGSRVRTAGSTVNRRKLDGETVVIVPAGAGALQIGVTAAEDGMLRALLTVHTDDLGDFAVVLTKHDLGLLAAASRTLLGMDADQVNRLRTELESQPEEGDK
jgi:hypothetical protein